MFRLSRPAQGWWFKGAFDRWSPAKPVREGYNPIAPFRSIFRNAKRKNVTQTQYIQARREKPCYKKQRLKQEKAYFKKWSYVKYCHQVVKHAMKHKLPFGQRLIKEADFRPAEPHSTIGLQKHVLTPPDGYDREQLLEMAQQWDQSGKAPNSSI